MLELPKEVGHYTSDDYRRDKLRAAQNVEGEDGVVRWLNAVFSRHGGLGRSQVCLKVKGATMEVQFSSRRAVLEEKVKSDDVKRPSDVEVEVGRITKAEAWWGDRGISGFAAFSCFVQPQATIAWCRESRDLYSYGG
jgi:hypothetical protein